MEFLRAISSHAFKKVHMDDSKSFFYLPCEYSLFKKSDFDGV